MIFDRWKENFNEGGISDLQSYSKQRNSEEEALEEQIRVLKRIVAKQQIELEFKTELFKKKVNPSSRGGLSNVTIRYSTLGKQKRITAVVSCSPK